MTSSLLIQIAMSIDDLKNRFKNFAIKVAQLIQKLPSNRINNAYANQLIRSSSSSAANYYAACRAKSPADFVNKLKIVEEELDESVLFLELLTVFNHNLANEIESCRLEGKELLGIIVQSIKTARNNRR
jgi:four helix bundle protein